VSVIVIGALALGRHASAQAPDEGFIVPPDSELSDDQFIIQPDTDLIGLPPGDGLILGPPVPAQVNFLFPCGVTRPTLCPRRKLPLEDEGATIVANYYPPKEGTGTFTWSSTTQGGNVFRAGEHDAAPLRAYGSFWTRTVSAAHGARVRYDKNGTYDQDDGSPIRVLDAELTFDGLGANTPDYTVEETPGVFIARGPIRKELALQFWPGPTKEDGDSYLPPNTPRIPPPYWMDLAKSTSSVKIYKEEHGTEECTDLSWGCYVKAGGVPDYDPPPATLWVEGATAGTSDLTLTLTYRQLWFPEPPIPTSVSASDKVKVTVVEVNLTATDLDGTVAEDKEESPGAFVHYNVDNDNDSNNELGGTKHPGGDFLETGQVTGENDLKPLAMWLAPDIREGDVVLSRSNAAVRVWKSALKGAGNEVLVGDDTKVWDMANDQQRLEFRNLSNSLFVEGNAGGWGSVSLAYAPPAQQPIIADTVVYDFIAADCGEQPRTENGQRANFETTLPQLKRCEWSVTAPANNQYNCIAWSVDETDHYYGGRDIDRDFGNPPDGVFDDSDMDKFYLAKKGWGRIVSGSPQEKAAQAEAMYYSYGVPWNYERGDPAPSGGYHAARRKHDCTCGAGRWIMYDSKCSVYERIEHVWDQLNDSEYGDPDRFYR